jgi:cobalt-zinc-cadmium efflux system protein
MRRFAAPPEIKTALMAWIAAGGLAVNAASAALLHRHAHGLNARAAFLHVIGDFLGSVGVLAASAAIALFGWRWADPVASVVIGVVVVVGTLSGVTDVHDLHLWSLGGRAPLLSAHLRIEHSARPHDVLRAATAALHERFGIEHVTLQVEPADFNIRSLLDPVDKGKASP